VTVRTARILLACTAVLSVVIVTLGAQRLGEVRSQVQSAQSALNQLTRDAEEVLELRGRQQRVELRQRPQQDVIAQVNAVLAEVGIPGRNLRSLSPESDTHVTAANSGSSQSKLKRQTLRLVLENLSIQEIGTFLLKWRSSQQVWTVTRIELTHARGQDSKDDHYDAALVISALYVEDTPAPAPAPESDSSSQSRS
jgi:Sec-independent protein translocase protein TatA